VTNPAPDELEPADCNDEPKLTAEEWAAVEVLSAEEEQR
jgi:hypothetical protein